MTLDEAITDLESCLAEDYPGEYLNVEALEIVLAELKQARALTDVSMLVAEWKAENAGLRTAWEQAVADLAEARERILVLESELGVARSLTKEALAPAQESEILDIVEETK